MKSLLKYAAKGLVWVFGHEEVVEALVSAVMTAKARK